ncbi:2-oxoacid:ferredoxin oxidoreductase subunit beta [Patescibacteria group bacterium]
MQEADKFKTYPEITWCPGCGNFGILAALKNAFLKLQLDPKDILIAYGVGCHGHMGNYLKTYGFQGLHGRALPVVEGAKIANHKLTVISVSGDGDQLGEGGNHLIHASRRNIDMTCVINNNRLYSLTVGQASPTTQKGMKTRTTPKGVIEEPLSPLALAIISGATFAARSFAGDMNHLTQTFADGINHKGFAVIDVLQPCVTLNKVNTFEWYKERIYKLKSDYNSKDKMTAIKKSLEFGDKIPIGILYQVQKPLFKEQRSEIKETPLVEQSLENISIEKLLEEFA